MQSEHENNISKTTVPITDAENGNSRSIGYILSITLAPLYLLAIIGAIVLALVMLVRYFISVTHFILQQNMFIVTMIVGMGAAIFVFTLSVVYALRKIGMLLQEGYTKQASVGLLVLAFVACMMILPILLALFFH
jgi:hypothetical protein